MNISLGNLSLEQVGLKDKMLELESKLIDFGYKREENCERNEDITKLTYHIYDIPRNMHFSVLDNKTISLLKDYSPYFTCRIGVSAKLIK